MNDYYVYAHLKVDGTPFYVGKGRGKRAYSKSMRSSWWKHQVQKLGNFPSVVLLAENLTEIDAHNVEKYWIALWGRRNVHPGGILINLTDGGEGCAGKVVSAETRAKMSHTRKSKGLKTVHSKDTALKISRARLGETQLVYLTHPDKGVVQVTNRAEFCRTYGLVRWKVSSLLRGKRSVYKNWSVSKK